MRKLTYMDNLQKMMKQHRRQLYKKNIEKGCAIAIVFLTVYMTIMPAIALEAGRINQVAGLVLEDGTVAEEMNQEKDSTAEPLLLEEKTDQDIVAIRYVNRLSDYLFTLARYLCAGNDDYWLP